MTAVDLCHYDGRLTVTLALSTSTNISLCTTSRMGRWTQFEEDAYRLPEGMRRIGYDADTKVYTFRDREGNVYQGEPGANYGNLTPVSNTGVNFRPGAFESDDEPRNVLAVNSESTLSTFHDILPANLITATTSPVDKSLLSPTSSRLSSHGEHSTPRARFVDAVRRTALPKMQGVVHNLRRSMTSTRRKAHPSEEEGTLPRQGSSNLQRSDSMATTVTAFSGTSTLVNDC